MQGCVAHLNNFMSVQTGLLSFLLMEPGSSWPFYGISKWHSFPGMVGNHWSRVSAILRVYASSNLPYPAYFNVSTSNLFSLYEVVDTAEGVNSWPELGRKLS
ncbi:hypothetical protein PoB_006955700 [Plakobranchus ocellatus]|uniref:Uncharacterized protein n=1 Tax=Plakobranchus ocellatus TaxID=259542 RepID=A0AAV4DFQ5_9GAST|nr:hypothetical protein PoB_006955700 [Plakobranchus ocellatus]